MMDNEQEKAETRNSYNRIADFPDWRRLFYCFALCSDEYGHSG
jgi:hypothetical protein